jgi:hypothetical protein
MYKVFGQIPKPNPSAASEIADAARHVESTLRDDFKPDAPLDPEHLPQTGVDMPRDDEAQEIVEEIEPWGVPDSLGQEEDVHEGAAAGVVEGGIEYLAFYKSFRDVKRSPAPNRWGIFFVKRRCAALATDMAYSTGESFADCLDGLAAFLYSHELYHYHFDAQCLKMEATGGLPVYRPYRSLVGSLPMDEWHEESIANYYGLQALKPNLHYPQTIRDYLWDLVANSPGAYAGGIDKWQWPRKDKMVQQASQYMRHAGPAAWQDLIVSTIRSAINLPRSNERSFMRLDHCPVYWIDWVKGGKSVLVPLTASVSEVNNDFVKRYLAGVLDHHSDHSFCRIDNGELVKLPNPHQRDVKNHEFHNIIGKAGMTSPQFYKERDRTAVWRKRVPRSPVLASRFASYRASDTERD